jgi:hypothetical protein
MIPLGGPHCQAAGNTVQVACSPGTSLFVEKKFARILILQEKHTMAARVFELTRSHAGGGRELSSQEAAGADWLVDDKPVFFSMGEHYGRAADVGTPIVSGIALIIGLLFLLAGLGIGRSFMPKKLVDGDGGGLICLFVTGLILGSMCLWSLVNSLIYLTWRKTNRDPALPFWQRDYPWDPSGCDDVARRAFREYTGCGSYALLCAVAPVGLGLTLPLGATALFWIARPFLLLSLFQLLCAVCVWRTNLRYGTSRLVYARCPFELGSRIEAEWLGGELLRETSRLEVTIRCLEERLLRNSSGGGGSDGTMRMQLFLLKRIFEPSEQMRVDGRLPFSVGLPATADLTTHLSARTSNAEFVVNRRVVNVQASPRYWMVTIRNPDKKRGFNAEFLVPVY